MHHHAFQRLDHGQVLARRRRAFDLKIAAAVVEELGEPLLLTLARQGVLPVGLAAAGGTAVHAFRRDSASSAGVILTTAAGRSLHADSRDQRNVLAQVVDRRARAERVDVHGLQDFQRHEWAAPRRRARAISLRAHSPLSRLFPARIGKARVVPALGLKPRIVVFAAIDAGERDGAGMNAPLRVGAHDVHRSVSIFEAQLADGLEGSKRADELRVAAAADVVHPIAEQNSDGVGAGPQQRGNVIGVVQHGLVVFRPTRRQQVVTHAPAVDGQLVLAQAADVHDGALKVRFHHELAAQQHGGIDARGSGVAGWRQRVPHHVDSRKGLAFRHLPVSR